MLSQTITRSDGHGEAHGFVIGVADADGEPAAVHPGFEIQNAKHFHTVGRDGVLVPDNADVPEAQRFDERLDDLVMRYRPVRAGAGRSGNQLQLRPSDLAGGRHQGSCHR